MDDARQIENLLYRYAELIDGGDYAGIGELFARARIVDGGGNLIAEGAAGVTAMYEASTRIYPETGTPRTKHVTTNVMVEVGDGAETARARSYYTVFQQTETLPLQAVITGRYHDQFQRGPDGWHFTERKMLMDQLGDLSQHLLIEI